MGHTRLGPIPTTQKWKTVVASVAGEGAAGSGVSGTLAENVELISLQALEAAQAGLQKALNDHGLQYTFYLLSQIAVASRQPEWQDQLAGLGILLPDDATIFDLTNELQGAIDSHLVNGTRSTDISEMAQQAAGDTLISLVGPASVSLFGSGRDDLRFAVQRVSTKQGFANLGQRFFGRFLGRFLNFYLSRVTAAQVGSDTLSKIGELSEFNKQLERHCEQSARVVRDYCGEWYSKTEYEGRITLLNTSRFMAVAVKKLQAEMEQQRKQP